MDQKVTTIQEILEYQKGQFVQLPDFAEGQPFFARLRRPSMMALVRSGKIPNDLINTANRLFNGRGMDEHKETAMSDVLNVFDVLCEATFVEPKYQDMKEAGIELTDEQMMAVFNYTQEGVKALEPFRRQPADNDGAGDLAKVQRETVQAVGG